MLNILKRKKRFLHNYQKNQSKNIKRKFRSFVVAKLDNDKHGLYNNNNVQETHQYRVQTATEDFMKRYFTDKFLIQIKEKIV